MRFPRQLQTLLVPKHQPEKQQMQESTGYQILPQRIDGLHVLVPPSQRYGTSSVATPPFLPVVTRYCSNSLMAFCWRAVWRWYSLKRSQAWAEWEKRKLLLRMRFAFDGTIDPYSVFELRHKRHSLQTSKPSPISSTFPKGTYKIAQVSYKRCASGL